MALGQQLPTTEKMRMFSRLQRQLRDTLDASLLGGPGAVASGVTCVAPKNSSDKFAYEACLWTRDPALAKNSGQHGSGAPAGARRAREPLDVRRIHCRREAAGAARLFVRAARRVLCPVPATEAPVESVVAASVSASSLALFYSVPRLELHHGALGILEVDGVLCGESPSPPSARHLRVGRLLDSADRAPLRRRRRGEVVQRSFRGIDRGPGCVTGNGPWRGLSAKSSSAWRIALAWIRPQADGVGAAISIVGRDGGRVIGPLLGSHEAALPLVRAVAPDGAATLKAIGAPDDILVETLTSAGFEVAVEQVSMSFGGHALPGKRDLYPRGLMHPTLG